MAALLNPSDDPPYGTHTTFTTAHDVTGTPLLASVTYSPLPSRSRTSPQLVMAGARFTSLRVLVNALPCSGAFATY